MRATRLAKLSAELLAQLKAQRLAVVVATAQPEGIWREAAVNFVRGRKVYV